MGRSPEILVAAGGRSPQKGRSPVIFVANQAQHDFRGFSTQKFISIDYQLIKN
jgi:hypothetical protein